MKPTYFLSLLSLLSSLFSCTSEDLSQFSQTIYVRNEGADLPAYIHGNASDKVFLIVLHGAGSFGLAFREGIFKEELEQDYAIVYLDQRGQSMAQGHYQDPEDQTEFVQRMARDVNALVLTLKHKFGEDITLFLFGHSWGGALGTTMLLTDDYQSHFSGWIDLDGIHDFPQANTAREELLRTTAASQIALGNSVFVWNDLLKEMDAKDPTEEGYYESLLYLAVDGMGALQADSLLLPEIVGSDLLYQTVFANNPIHWTISDWFNKPFAVAKEIDYSLTHRLDEIRLPTLLLWGQYDFSVPPALGVSAYEKIGSAEKKLVIFEQSAHNPLLSEPDAVLAQIQAFLEQHK